MKSIRFTIPGPPRTKKTSNRISGYGRKCPVCGKPDYQKIIPSKAYEKWFKASMTLSPILRTMARDQGVALPIMGPVQVRAIFHYKGPVGDIVGYQQGLADFLQEPRFNEKGKTTRHGAGIIEDDSQIEHWDGSRRVHDLKNPRIEVEIIPLGEADL